MRKRRFQFSLRLALAAITASGFACAFAFYFWIDEPAPYQISIRFPNVDQPPTPCDIKKYGVTVGKLTSFTKVDGALIASADIETGIQFRSTERWYYVPQATPPFVAVDAPPAGTPIGSQIVDANGSVTAMVADQDDAGFLISTHQKP